MIHDENNFCRSSFLHTYTLYIIIIIIKYLYFQIVYALDNIDVFHLILCTLNILNLRKARVQ